MYNFRVPVRTLKTLLVALLAIGALAPHMGAQQSLPFSLFERYLDALRQQSGIPGLSAAIAHNDRLVWDRAFGYQDVAAFETTRSDTPYPILDLSQTFSATVLLEQCLDLRSLELTDRVRRWHSQFTEENTTVGQLLSHAAPEGGFKYDTSRYATLTSVIEQCAQGRYGPLLAETVLNRLGMTDTVPGHDLADESPSRQFFSSGALDRYAAVLRRAATPYRVDSRGRPTRTDYPHASLSASTGVVSTARDLARFDTALDDLLESGTRQRAWEPSESMPTGLGWFVQRHNGERIVWHFGLARDAYSALYIKVPGRDLTLILLANSDGLAAPYNLSNGNLTVSVFAQLFLKLFVS